MAGDVLVVAPVAEGAADDAVATDVAAADDDAPVGVPPAELEERDPSAEPVQPASTPADRASSSRLLGRAEEGDGIPAMVPPVVCPRATPRL
jgi:hypothetical protein